MIDIERTTDDLKELASLITLEMATRRRFIVEVDVMMQYTGKSHDVIGVFPLIHHQDRDYKSTWKLCSSNH